MAIDVPDREARTPKVRRRSALYLLIAPPELPRRDTRERRLALYRDACRVLVERHDEHDLAVDDVAYDIATSRRQLQRVMLEMGGASFTEALRRVRLAHAAQLLVRTSMPVSEVCARVGYKQPAQFAKTFRAHFGAAPASYRRERAGVRPFSDGAAGYRSESGGGGDR